MCAFTNLMFLLIAVTVHAINANECGDNWIKFDTKCYYFNETVAVTFSDARQICHQMDSHLVSLHSREEQEFVKSYFKQNLTWFEITANYYWRYHVWLGGDLDPPGSGKRLERVFRSIAVLTTGFHVAGTIKWHDGSPFDFEDWDYPNHPSLSCSMKDCCAPALTLSRRNNWIDFNCNAQYSVACKRPLPQRIEEIRVQERLDNSGVRLIVNFVLLTLIAMSHLLTL